MIKRYCSVISAFGNVHRYEQDGGIWVKHEDHEREVKELERRVRWLEYSLERAIDSAFCRFCNAEIGHFNDCEVFGEHNYIKPTPEDFK